MRVGRSGPAYAALTAAALVAAAVPVRAQDAVVARGDTAAHDAAARAGAAPGYREPPEIIRRILDAPPTPAVLPAPDGRTLVLLGRPGMPAIAELAEPELALVVLVQGAGVSQSVPNPDGSRRRPSRDFIAQGAANVAAGFMRGVPVGGSLGATALNVVSGAGRRWASIFAGLWMALFVIALPGVVSRVAMPALGALLILAGIRSIKPADVSQVWRAGWLARTAAAVTFLATLILPIQLAVGSGVLLSALLYVGAASTDISVFELSERSDGRLEERNPPRHLPARRATILDVYGDLFYAGARTLERKLPLPGAGERPIVILRLRGFNEIGATLIEVLSDYADQLRQVGGRLYLTGIGTRAFERLKATGEFRLTGPVRLYEATPVLRESTRRALADAEAWLAGSEEDSTTDAEDEHAGADDDRNA